MMQRVNQKPPIGLDQLGSPIHVALLLEALARRLPRRLFVRNHGSVIVGVAPKPRRLTFDGMMDLLSPMKMIMLARNTTMVDRDKVGAVRTAPKALRRALTCWFAETPG
jgi:hypothetical protein